MKKRANRKDYWLEFPKVWLPMLPHIVAILTAFYAIIQTDTAKTVVQIIRMHYERQVQSNSCLVNLNQAEKAKN